MLSIAKNNKNGGADMKKSLFASILIILMGGLLASSVIADQTDDTLVRFKGAIGDLPVSNVAGTVKPDGTLPHVARDIFRGVHPPRRNLGISPFSADGA